MDYRPALRQRTGVGEYAHHLASALVGLLGPADQLALFSSSWKDRLAPGTIPGAAVVDARVPVSVLNYTWHRLGWPPVEWLAGRVDVAHALHPLLIPATRAAQVVTIADLSFLDVPDSTTAEIRRDYAELSGPHARQADAVVVISAYTRMQVERRFGVPPERVFLCPPGAPAWRPRTSLDGPAHVLFIGTIGPRKNVGALLEAYEALRARAPDAPPLVLAGGVAPGAGDVVAALRRAPTDGTVRHLGYVPDMGREDLFRQACLLVLPSLDEGFGMPVLEAMAMGVPVVTSNRGALPELVGDAGLIVDPDDIPGLSRAMERMLTDTAFAQACVRRGLERATQYTWEGSARQLLNAYVSAAAHRSARR
ncbi:MAG TPA: glycosyltransferase family 1 protein [Vicinamibacterales bacterium]|nr:glycosyltransferase family 1 protein [Vicinamibacterales bacterium]